MFEVWSIPGAVRQQADEFRKPVSELLSICDLFKDYFKDNRKKVEQLGQQWAFLLETPVDCAIITKVGYWPSVLSDSAKAQKILAQRLSSKCSLGRFATYEEACERARKKTVEYGADRFIFQDGTVTNWTAEVIHLNGVVEHYRNGARLSAA